MIVRWCLGLLLFIITLPAAADFQADSHNKASLQRGAQLYFNYCASCHSLGYETYSNIATYLGASALPTTTLAQALLFDPAGDINQTIRTALSPEDGQRWFGVAPPDLTTIASQKTPQWLYAFLRGFYQDPTKIHGTNNVIAINTAMPNVLSNLRGEVQPVFKNHHIDHLITVKAGELSPLAFDRAMADLVNFLSYIAEPWQNFRIALGIAITSLLFLLALICQWLFKET